jgi:cellulose synthase/poly-beta-1,6-N-acetylglucosamine synthase-like glycosyltransferase
VNWTCGVIIPVRNEAAIIGQTVSALKAAVGHERARLIWVCNGCTDDSALLLQTMAGTGSEVIILDEGSKTKALQAGDDMLGDLFPRLYLDADVRLAPGDLGRLMAPLRTGHADVTTARHVYDCSKASFAARAMARCWMALPYANVSAVMGVIAVSQRGRALWGHWPTLMGDDVFVTSTVPEHRSVMVDGACATTWPPRDFGSWVRMRKRWLTGEKQVAALGLAVPKVPKQRWGLVRQFLKPSTFVGAALFASARLLAGLAPGSVRATSWYPDRESEDPPVVGRQH